jgi:transposase-like protein
MRKGWFSEEQIINVLKEHQGGIPVVELCRKHGISDATFYTWRTKYGATGNPRGQGHRCPRASSYCPAS